MGFVKKILLLSTVFTTFLFSVCDPITSTANEPLRLVNWVCLDDKNITAIHTNGKYLYTATTDSNITRYSMSKQNFPVANTLALKRDANASHTLEGNITSIIGTGEIGTDVSYILIGSDSGVQSLKYVAPNRLDINDTHNSQFTSQAMALYTASNTNYVFIGDGPTLKIVNLDLAGSDTNGLSYGSNSNTTLIGNYLNIDGNITGIAVYKQHVYVSTKGLPDGPKVINKFQIIQANSTLALENKQVFELSTTQNIYINDDKIFAIDGNISDGNMTVSDLDGNILLRNEQNITAMIGNRHYRVELGLDGLKIYENNSITPIASDTSFAGDKLLAVGEHFITNDLNSSYIRIYKFGKIGADKTDEYAPVDINFFIQKYNLQSISWSFGDGTSYSSLERNTTHKYTTAGSYEAKATVIYKDDIPHSSTAFSMPLNIRQDDAPSVIVEADAISGQIPLIVDFNSTITYSGYINSIKWDLKDGNTTTLPGFKHTYNGVGDYNVSLIVYYGVDKNVTKYINIKAVDGGNINIANSAGANISAIGDTLTFSSTLPTGVNESSVSSFSWIFGDGRVSNVAVPKYQYSGAGNYSIRLNIKTISGLTYTMTKDLVIYADAQHYLEATPAIGESPLEVNYNVRTSSTISGVAFIRSASCRKPDGSTSILDSFRQTLTREGNHIASCTLTLSDGSTKNISKTVTVDNNITLTPTLTTTSGKTPLNVSFSSTYTTRSGAKSIKWDFGNGSTFTGGSTSYTYNNPGTYNGKVTLTTNKNHIVVKTFQIEVSKTPTVNVYATKLSTYKYKFEAVISDYTTEIKSYWWEFRSNEKSNINQTSVDHTFSSLANYTAIFKVQYSDNTVSSHSHTVSVTGTSTELRLDRGWNLISAPVDVAFQQTSSSSSLTSGTLNMNVLKNTYVSLIWTFFNNTWISNPRYIPKRVGIWAKSSTSSNTLSFSTGNTYAPNFTSLSKNKWHLLGTGIDIVDFQNTYGQYISKSYIYGNLVFTLNPYFVRRGQGVWVLTKP